MQLRMVVQDRDTNGTPETRIKLVPKDRDRRGWEVTVRMPFYDATSIYAVGTTVDVVLTDHPELLERTDR